MERRAATKRGVRIALVGLLAMTLAACAHAPLPLTTDLAWQDPPAAGDSTLGLWRLDETTGLTLVDSSAAHRDGAFGIDTRSAFGRFANAREFTASINSWAIVPADRAPRLGNTWTIEAWVQPEAYGQVECSVIAARWTDQPNEQGWMLGLTGFNRSLVAGAPPRPDLFTALIPLSGAGDLVFAYQPEGAGAPRAFESTVAIDKDRWTHVAITHDGRELRMYIDGRLDAQFADVDAIHDASVPLVIGNQLDARWLTESIGSLQVPSDAGFYPFYAFEGAIDEVRISSVALTPGGRKK